ncbi:pilus assembly protein PilP [Tahibacter amnicola]|uniref:Pilus assembly protein PilP n=1 Tax=Tahibacter amnicola TaxID=2976241 RepID=A0ABY6BDU8_9GAMM|nr:pilus assembly protein PilP [Tahibacter amnicola]UXI68213.1 pilus assembly protein PilP [Tahibacter amnicola]
MMACSETLLIAGLLVFPIVGISNCIADDGRYSQRVGGPELTFQVPVGFAQCEIYGVEGNQLQWSKSSSTVSYERVWRSDWEDAPTSGRNFCTQKLARADVKFAFSESEAVTGVAWRVTLRMRSPDSSPGYDYVSVFGEDQNEVCEVAAGILDSYSYSNLVTRIDIDHIPEDAGYVVLINHDGQVRAAVVGEVVARNGGRVVEISKRFVKIAELRPDESGGYSYFYTKLNWDPERRKHSRNLRKTD